MELSKVRTAEEIIARFKDGQIIAIGGQTNQYMPDRLIDCVLESGARHLTNMNFSPFEGLCPSDISHMPKLWWDTQRYSCSANAAPALYAVSSR